MKTLNYTIILSSILPFIASCSLISDTVDTSVTWIVKKPKTNVTKGEVLTISPITTKKSIGGANTKSTFSAKAISFVVDELDKGVSNSAKRFSSIYNYRYVGTDLTVVRGFTLKRTVALSSERPASEIHLSFGTLGENTGVMNVEVDEIIVNFPKSAIARWDKDVDLIINVNLAAFDAKSSRMVTLVDSTLTTKGCELGKPKKFKNDDQQPRTSWFSLPKVNESNHKCPYVIKVTVNEIANFYKTAEKGQTLLSDNKDKIKSKLGNFF